MASARRGTPPPSRRGLSADPTDDLAPLVTGLPGSGSDGQPRQPVLDPPMVPFAVAGLVIWAVAGLVLYAFCHDWLVATHRENWLHICLAGFLVGIPGLITMIRHDANRRRRGPSA